MDGESEEEQESADTGEDEDGGDESDLVILAWVWYHGTKAEGRSSRWGDPSLDTASRSGRHDSELPSMRL